MSQREGRTSSINVGGGEGLRQVIEVFVRD